MKNVDSSRVFGPPYAVVNLSRVGLRYFRFFLNMKEGNTDVLIRQLKDNPNVGWVFAASGWFNVGVGVWASTNAEIVNVSTAIRNLLSEGDVIVYQSELTSLYAFAQRPYEHDDTPLAIVDAVDSMIELAPIDIDYIKIVTMDVSLTVPELADLLGVSESDVQIIHTKLVDAGVIVGTQERINHAGTHHKVFVDTLSKKRPDAADDLLRRLWADDRCVYVERAVAKYDLEFELILEDDIDIGTYLTDFSEYECAVLTDNLYTNLYPLSKVANFKEIRAALAKKDGNVVDLRNSKLWYLNYRGAGAYLNIYENKEYFDVMERGELDLFGDISQYIRDRYPNKHISLVDVGSGNGLKARRLIEKIGKENIKAYYPVDIQPIELAAALESHKESAYARHPTLVNFELLGSHFPLKMLPNESQIYVLFGGTYGNFSAPEINSYLRPVLLSGSTLFVAMPIIAESQSQIEILQTYMNEKLEDVAFGPLVQAGFVKGMFKQNSSNVDRVLHIEFENERLVTSFVLARNASVPAGVFEEGTLFKVTTSWKPTLRQFREALAADFEIVSEFVNDRTAIIAITQKKV